MHRDVERDIVIVTPALADANNGNWQTAQRWARLLADMATRVRIASAWQGGDETLMIALHARRSAPSIAAWKRLAPGRPLVVALTGTDLYGDIDRDPDAQRSLQLANRLVVLNELGGAALPASCAPKARVVLQSCGARRAVADKPRDRLRALMVGHLRPEKAPATYFEAVRRLAHRPDLRFDHVGAALDPVLGDAARALAASTPTYRWLGPLPHPTVRRRIQAAHVLVHPSRLEGGAHVVIEAVRSGTPVLASRIDGNVGLLGADYDGYFAVGDGAALAEALAVLRDDPAMLDHLRAQCAARDALFAPTAEQSRLRALLAELPTPALPGAVPCPQPPNPA